MTPLRWFIVILLFGTAAAFVRRAAGRFRRRAIILKRGPGYNGLEGDMLIGGAAALRTRFQQWRGRSLQSRVWSAVDTTLAFLVYGYAEVVGALVCIAAAVWAVAGA